MDSELPDPPERPAAAHQTGPGPGSDDEDLTGSLTALAGLSTARLTLEDLLTKGRIVCGAGHPGRGRRRFDAD
jgi:hypothetical protein